MSMRYTLLR